MSDDWVTNFGLKGNPFSTSPLEDDFELDNLLVKTKSIQDQVLPIGRFIENSRPSIKILLGARGSGKSTCLSYLRKLVYMYENVLTINISEIRQPERVIEDPTYGIGAPMVWMIVKDIIQSLEVIFEDVYIENSDLVSKIIDSLDISELYPPKFPLWSTCNNALDLLLEILKKNKISLFIGIDNYDKLPHKFQEIAIDFLRGNNAQPFFEKLQRAGSTILMTMGNEFYANILHPDFSYLGKPIEITGLNPNETKELLSKRIEWMINQDLMNSDDIFTDESIHKLTMHTNGIPRDVLIFAEQCMINAGKRNQQTVSEKIVENTIQKFGEQIEEYYEIIKKIKPLSYALVAENGMKILSAYFSTLNTSEFALNVIDKLIYMYKDPNQNFDLNNQYIKSLKDSNIISFVDNPTATTSKGWTVRLEILNLMKQMDDKKVLRKFMDWLMAKEVQVKPPDYQIIRNVKHGAELAKKIEKFIDIIDTEEIKSCLTKAIKRIRELDSYTLEEDLDSNTQITGMVEIVKEISTAIYYLSKLTQEEDIPKKIPKSDRLNRFLRRFNADLWFDMDYIQRMDELRYLQTVSKNRIQEASSKYATFVDKSYIILNQLNSKLIETQDKIYEVIINDIEDQMDQLFSDRLTHIILEDANYPNRMAIVLWKTLSDKSEIIYGFGTGDLVEGEIEELKKRVFKEKGFMIFENIENDILVHRPSILRDFYIKNYSVKFFHNTDFSSFFNDIMNQSHLNGGLQLIIMRKGVQTSRIFINKKGRRFRLLIKNIVKECIDTTKTLPKLVIIDGNNLARSGKKKSRKAKWHYITNAILKLREMKIETATIVTKSLFNDIDDQNSLKNAISTGLISLSPGNKDDDYYYLTYALEHQAFILTNDNLRDWKKKNPEISVDIAQKRIPFFIFKNEVYFEGILEKIKS